MVLVIPAIDLREGRCVRLLQGRLEDETVFSHNPLEMALSWQEQGAAILHVVDLDGAFAGEPCNHEPIRRILEEMSIPVQVGGGIRTLETMGCYLDQGAARVILGTAALYDADLVKQAARLFGSRLVVGIDSKNGLAAAEGWATTVARTALEVALEVRDLGVERIVYTDIWRDGALTGPNLEATLDLARESGMKIIASGGISSLEDLLAVSKLEPWGVEGAIVGRALYNGNFTLQEAIRAAEGE